MKPKAIRITYWVLLILFCLAMAGDAAGGLTHAKAGVDALNHLGYPEYLLTFFGIAKVLGIIALLQDKYKSVKEWAFAGFAFNFLGATWSRIQLHDPAGMIVPSIIMLIYLAVLYYFWRRYELVKTT